MASEAMHLDPKVISCIAEGARSKYFFAYFLVLPRNTVYNHSPLSLKWCFGLQVLVNPWLLK